MPDIHCGYGFPIGGVAAMDAQNGVISPGGVGFDINCGVRVIRTNLKSSDLTGSKELLTNKIYSAVPCGVGSKSDIKVASSTLKKVLNEGSSWAVRNGFGWDSDLEYTEENGRLELSLIHI